MPSVDSTTSANWLKTAPTTQFGTRELTLVKVLVGGTNASMILVDGSTAGATGYLSSSSLYSNAVRTLQNFAEIYAVYTPVATGFLALIAADTANGADSGNTQATTFGLAEAAIKAAIQALNAQTDVTVTITAPAVTIGTTL